MGIETTSDFWDCECEEKFIHPRCEAFCPDCGAVREEQPDSRTSEIDRVGLRDFTIDHENSKDEYLFVNVPKHNLILSIKCEFEGVVVDFIDPEGEIVNTAACDMSEFVMCSLCHKMAFLENANLHQGKWIGECCWDERLKNSE